MSLDLDLLALIAARVVEIYLALGLLFAIAFAARGVEAIDPSARESTRGFRILLLPGAIALWPLLLHRWLTGAPQPVEHNAHRDSSDANGGDA